MLGDGDQSLEDPYDFVAQSIRHYTGKQSLESQDLNLSFRVSPIVREFAQLILDAKAKVVGGNVNKDIKHTIDTAKDDEEGGGILKFINERDGRTIEALRGNIRVNNLDTIIIIFAEEDREEARSIFADGNSSPIVIHARNALGLEWNNVVLFKPFGDNSPLYRHKKLIETNYDASAPVPTSRLKNDHGIEAVIPFNEFYVAATRPLNGLYVFDHANNPLANLFETASTHIWSKSKDLEVESAKEQTLEELMAYIKNNSKVLDYEQILKQLISQAVERIETTTHDAKITKKYLTNLKQLIQEKDSDLVNRVDAILSPILEAEKAADGASRARDKRTDEIAETKAEKTPQAPKPKAAEGNTKDPTKITKPKADSQANFTSSGSDEEAPSSPSQSPKSQASQAKLKPVKAKSSETKHKATYSGSLYSQFFSAIENANVKTVINIINNPKFKPNTIYDGKLPLLKACFLGYAQVVRALLTKGADVNMADNDGTTPLCLAVNNGDNALVRKLLQNGANPNIGPKSAIPLIQACIKGYTEIVSALLAFDAALNLTNKVGQTAFYVACQKGNWDILELLFINVTEETANYPDTNGTSPLHLACTASNQKLVARLLAAGANPNQLDKRGLTPLLTASYNGDAAVVDRLLKAGAEINNPNNGGVTPLCIASYNSHVKVVELLLNAGAEINKPNNDGQTPLYVACQKGNWDILELLFSNVTEETANYPDTKGISPLHLACEAGDYRLVARLLAAGAKPNHFDKMGVTPLMIACENLHPSIVAILLDRGSAVSDSCGITTKLFIECYNGNADGVSLLLEEKATHNLSPMLLVQLLWVACKKDHQNVVKLILGQELQPTNLINALLIASKQGHVGVVELLLNAGAKPNPDSGNKAMPLWVASYNNHPLVVELLLKAGADPNLTNHSGFTPLEISIEMDFIEIASLLLRHPKIDVSKVNIDTLQNGFDLAIQDGNWETVNLLLRHPKIDVSESQY
ncbi:MAG UNVERIFIED_CONTAM: ankyrin repeat domain-containing protein [Rickettsiaceae bacterium]